MGNVSLYYQKITDGGSQFCILTGDVRHSQNLSAAKIHPWVAVKPDVINVSGRCTYMAGFGEVCSHATALLFVIKVNNRVIQNTSCTSLPCMWMPAMQKVDYAPIKDIDLTNPKKIKVVCGSGDSAESTATTSKASESSSTASCAGSHSNILIAKSVAPPSESELKNFYERLALTDSRAVILLITPPHSEAFVPSRSSDTIGGLPKQLSLLYDAANLGVLYPELL